MVIFSAALFNYEWIYFLTLFPLLILGSPLNSSLSFFVFAVPLMLSMQFVVREIAILKLKARASERAANLMNK